LDKIRSNNNKNNEQQSNQNYVHDHLPRGNRLAPQTRTGPPVLDSRTLNNPRPSVLLAERMNNSDENLLRTRPENQLGKQPTISVQYIPEVNLT
jgi:hypothetical protein